MLVGNLRELAEAIITGDKYKASGSFRDLAEAIITGDKYKAPGGSLRDFADALISSDKYKAPSGPLRDVAEAIITGDKYKASSEPLRGFAEAVITGDKYKASGGGGGGCYLTTACVDYASLSDDCRILTVMRRFRDEFMATSDVGRSVLEEYYETAPALLQRIRLSPNADSVFREMLLELESIVQMIDDGNLQEAFQRCLRGYHEIKSRYPA